MGKRITVAALPLPCAPLTQALLLWCPGLPLQAFPVVELLTPVPSGCLFIANSCCLPGSTLQTLLPSNQPLFHDRRPMTLAGVCSAQTICSVLTLSCLPQTVLCIPQSPQSPFLSKLISPPCVFLSDYKKLSSPSTFHHNCWTFVLFLSFFLPFILTSCEGVFLNSLGIQSL